MPDETLCCSDCEEEWEVRRLELSTLGPVFGGGSVWVLAHTATCVLFVVGLSMLLLTLLALPPWVESDLLELGLVVDMVVLVLLLRPSTVQRFARRSEARARRRFLAERPD